MDGLQAATAAGNIDERFVEVLRRVATVASRARAAPNGAPRWSAEDIDDLALETIGRVTPAKVVLAAQRASSDIEFRGWLAAAVRTTLNLRARETPSGQVMRAVDDALREDPLRFVVIDGHWTLVGDERPPSWCAGTEQLVREAWKVETTLIRHSAAVEKTPPMAHRRDIRAVAEVVLLLAGPLPKVVLAETLAARFNVMFAARFDYLDREPDGQNEPPSSDALTAYEEVDDRLAAEWMLNELTAEERRVLAIVATGGGVRGVGAELACANEKAATVTKRLHAKLRRLAELSGGDGEAATEILLDLVGRENTLRHSLDNDGDPDAT